MADRLPEERVREIAEDGTVIIEPFGHGIANGVGNEPWPSREAALLAAEVLALREEQRNFLAFTRGVADIVMRPASPEGGASDGQ